jgi:hypothetical protein
MANPFQDKQDTTGGKAGFAAFNQLTSDKAYDDETIKENPGGPLPSPVENPPDEFTEGVRQVERPDYEGIQLKKFTDLKKSAEALDFIFEDEYIKEINRKKFELVTINGNAFAAINAVGVNYPQANERLISTTSDCPSDPALTNNEKVVFDSVEPTGLTTFIYPTSGTSTPTDTPPCTVNVNCELVGVKGKIYPDVLAAYHFPVLSNNSHGPTDLPTANGTFTIVSKDKTGSGYYSTNTLGIGLTLRLFNDNVTQSVTQSEDEIGDYYFFGGNGANANNALAGAATSISLLIDQINDIRASLKVRIGPPEVVNSSAGVNTLRSSKHREELDTWFIEEGNRTTNIFDFQGGMDSLVGNASSISSYNL